jgi:hypothetical protein
MPSPFPGMDPYLERHWPDIQTSMVVGAADALNRSLPDDMYATIDERDAIEDEDSVPAFLKSARKPSEGEASVPRRRVVFVEPLTERLIKILDGSKERLVTVIEFISPENRHGKGLSIYRSAREQLIDSGVNFVEIDLIRAGDWDALLRPHSAERRASLYRATIRVVFDRPVMDVQEIRLQNKLPEVHIPLRRDDPKLMLELQPLLNHAYDRGRYARRIDYRRAVEPPLDAEDAAWVDELLRAAQRR